MDPTGHLVQTPASVALAKAIEAGLATAAPAAAGVGTAVVSLGATAVLAVGGVAYAALKTNEAVDELEASTVANERMRRQHQLIIEQQREVHTRQTTQAKAKAGGAPPPQQGTLILEDEDANEVLADRRRRDEAQKSGIDLGQATYRALPGGASRGESEEEIGELQRMALEVQAAHKNKVARDHSVTAAGRVRYGDGRVEYWVSSSEDAPRTEQQELIKQYGAKVIRGKGDAEVTLVNAYETARRAGIELTLEEIGASRPICIDCEMRMEQAGVRPEAGNPLKKAPSDRVMRGMRREQQLQGPKQLVLPTEDQKKERP